MRKRRGLLAVVLAALMVFSSLSLVLADEYIEIDAASDQMNDFVVSASRVNVNQTARTASISFSVDINPRVRRLVFEIIYDRTVLQRPTIKTVPNRVFNSFSNTSHGTLSPGLVPNASSWVINASNNGGAMAQQTGIFMTVNFTILRVPPQGITPILINVISVDSFGREINTRVNDGSVRFLGIPTHSVTILNGGEGARATPVLSAEGWPVNLSAGTRFGYVFAGWTTETPDVTIINPSYANGAYFIMPGRNVTVTANWEAIPPPNLVQVSAPHVIASVGSYIDIPITLDYNYAGLSSMSISIAYDSAALQRVDIASLDIFNMFPIQPPLGVNPFPIMLFLTPPNSVTNATGDIASIRFNVLDDAPLGVTPVLFSVASAYRFDASFVPIDVLTIDGSVEIIEIITHPIIIENGGEGAEASPNPAEEGATVVLYAGTPPTGYVFVGWTTETPGVTIIDPTNPNGASFQMPDGPVTITANWERPVTVRVSASHSLAQRGRYAYVVISLDENQGLNIMSLSLSYDSAILTRDSVTPDSLMTMMPILPGANPFTMGFMFPPPEASTETGNLATIRFRINHEAPLGATPIELSVVSAYRIDGLPVPVNAVATDGSVYVTLMFGDVNGDGIITQEDVDLLWMYLLGFPVDFNREAADVNGDGIITLADILLIMMYLNGDLDILEPQSQSGVILMRHMPMHLPMLMHEISTDEMTEYIDVVVNIGANEGISALSLVLNYDASILQRVTISPADLMVMPLQPPSNNGSATLSFMTESLGVTTDTGNLAAIRFRVLNNEALETAITLQVTGAYKIDGFIPVPVNSLGLEIYVI
ncbi:MAG: cohesin domain-containing protein [Defluviitaleaceae bacterium]|nr:cohesin domain-containing protein [Defluviitaleaceae bacterium]